MKPLACLLALCAVVVPARAADPLVPNAVLRVRNLKEFRDDLFQIDRLSRGEEAAKEFDDHLTRNFGKDHAGLDMKRPAGLYAFFDEQAAPCVLLLPIADEKRFLEKMKEWFGGNIKEEEGVYHMPGGWFSPRSFRFANQYVYINWFDKELLAKQNLPDPVKLLDLDGPATVTGVIHLHRIPEAGRKMGLEGINQLVARTRDRMPGESELARQLRVKVAQNIARWAGDVVKEGDRLELQAGVDRKTDDIVMDLNLVPKSKSKLAQAIAQLGKGESRFVGPRTRQAVGMNLHWDLPEDLKQAVRPVVDEAIRRAMLNASAETMREHAAKLTEALEPTLAPGQLDAGFSLMGPSPDKRFTLVAGFKVRQGKALDEALRGLIKSLPARDRDKFRFDVTSVKGQPVHRADVQYDFEDRLAPYFGKHPAFFTLTDDAFWLTLGPDGESALKASLAARPVPVQLLRYELSFARLITLMPGASTPPPPIQKLADRVMAKPDGADRVLFTVEGGPSLRARFALKAPALEFIRESGGPQSYPLAWLFR